jgi:hypothetical protein
MNDEFKKQLHFFDTNYELIFCDTSFHGQKIYIGNSTNRICRFCGQSNPEVTFKTISHTAPEFLGNKKYISNDECDTCNKFFSENLENYLDKFTKPYRTLARMKGKDKIPKYKSKDKKTLLQSSKNNIYCEDVIDSGFLDLNTNKKCLTMNFTLEPYIPTAVYKCFVKIALSFLPNSELGSFQKAIKWLKEKDHSKKLITPQLLFQKFIPGINPVKNLSIMLLRRKPTSDIHPYAYQIIAFGNFFYQLIIPSDKDFNQSKTITYDFRVMPSPWELKNKRLQCKKIDLTSHDTIKDEIKIINISFDTIEKFYKESDMDNL